MKLKRLRDIFLMFMACAFLGWIYEVLVGILETHVGYVNRGFLFGPYLPIYGFGGIILITLLMPIRNKKIHLGRLNISFVLVFLSTMLITTILELVGSYFMELIMGDWLWDYSNYFCNFEGRIALWSSVKFGLGGLIIIYLIEPAIRFCIEKSNQKAVNIFTVLLGVIFIVDLGLRPFLGSNFIGK